VIISFRIAEKTIAARQACKGAPRYVENVTIVGKSVQPVGAGNGRTEVDGASLGRVFTLATGQAGPDEAIGIVHLTATHAQNGAGGMDNAGSPLTSVRAVIQDNVPNNCVGSFCPP
jgi:hypothetical protein